MELRESYKLTEVGVIPNDWAVCPIDEIAEIKTGSKNTDDNVENGQYPFFVRSQKVERINTYCCDEEAVLTAGDGVGVGKVFHYINGKFDVHQRVYKISKFTGVDGKFFFEYFRMNFLNQVSRYTAKSSVDSVRMDMIAKMPIPIPPLLEQRAIAAALGDVDALIASLDALIAKKRDIKQGAMQELLTGKKRLAGFGGEWVVKQLGTMGEFKNGINKGKIDFGFGFPFVNLLDVFGKSKLMADEDFGLINSTPIERNMYQLRKGDVLFVRSSVKPEGVGLTSVVGEDLPNTVFSSFLIRFRDFSTIDIDYKVFCFYEEGFRKRLIDASTVSANTNINQDALKVMEIRLPLTKEEQHAIAEILTDMDNEIAALEQKRAKYELLKQGMMQELLTGKTRLQ